MKTAPHLRTAPHADQMSHGKVLDIDLHGRLSREDYEKIGPETERLIAEYGKIRILVTMHDFEGWNAGAFWEDLKWEAKHFNDVERLAIIGEEGWQRWMAKFCTAFTRAEVKYFTFAQLDDAYRWVHE